MTFGRVLPGRSELLSAMAIALALTLIGVTAAIAGNMSFQSGGGQWGSGATFSFVIVGAGNVESATVTAMFDGTAPALCQNKGGKVAPGQNPITVAAAGSALFPFDSNGRAEGTTDEVFPSFASPLPTAREAGCPNGNWTVIGPDASRVSWTSVHAVAVDDENNTAEIFLICTTFTRSNGTTFGECVEVSG